MCETRKVGIWTKLSLTSCYTLQAHLPFRCALTIGCLHLYDDYLVVGGECIGIMEHIFLGRNNAYRILFAKDTPSHVII